MATLGRTKFPEIGAQQLGVASHAHQLTLDCQQFEPKFFQVELDEFEVAGVGSDVIAATGCGDDKHAADDAQRNDRQQTMTRHRQSVRQ